MPTSPIKKPKEKKESEISSYVVIGFVVLLVALLIGLGTYSGGIEKRLSDVEWELTKAINSNNETIRLLENASAELIQKTMELQILVQNYTELQSEHEKKLQEINDLNDKINELKEKLEENMGE
jgi:hypothetical protein